MNKTKRKIFETSMKLFAEKGYDGTSIEEITSVVGVAKGTLYYHFSSKEEIFNFLVEEGMNLLKNSITIKTNKQEKYIDKLRAIVLIQIKIIDKYENFMSIILSEILGNSSRSLTCKKTVEEYLIIMRNVIEQGIEAGELIKIDSNIFSYELLGMLFTSLYFVKNNKLDIEKLFKQIDHDLIESIKKS